VSWPIGLNGGGQLYLDVRVREYSRAVFAMHDT